MTVSSKVGSLEYKVNIANNLRALQPELPKQILVQSSTPLTINEIATKTGVYSLLLVGGVVDKAIYPLDQPIKINAEILLIGPVAGG